MQRSSETWSPTRSNYRDRGNCLTGSVKLALVPDIKDNPVLLNAIALNIQYLVVSYPERNGNETSLDPSFDAVGYVFSWELRSCRIGDRHTGDF